MSKFRKSLYLFAHVITPLTYFVVAVAWGHLVLSTPLWTNLTDNLSIMALYYIGISVLWHFNIDKVEEEFVKTKEEPDSRTE
ncbi:hypothetical protein [Halobacillus litoralis]|uniref:hypothetical protein n=1 Tax=Halobacillus litoralis TaxID=45668 RepID=UPI001CD5D497|nr:hypothetical protein [Halobacillus litoralis]MCA1021765.1 hypothetical protein [Halobacillus litoralis]